MLHRPHFFKIFFAILLFITSVNASNEEERSQSKFKILPYIQTSRALDYLSDEKLIESRLTNALFYECAIDLLSNRMARAYADCVVNDVPVPENVIRALSVIQEEKRAKTMEMIRQLVIDNCRGILVKQFRELPNFLKSSFQKKLSADAIKSGLSSQEWLLQYMDADHSLATDTRIAEHIFNNHAVATDLTNEEAFESLRRHRLAEYSTFESLKESQATTLPKYVLVNADDFNNPGNREDLKRLIAINNNSIWIINFGDAASYGNGFGYDHQSWCKVARVIIQGKNLATVGNAFLSGWRDLAQAKLPDSLVSVGGSFMSGTSVEELNLPPNLTDTDDFFLFQCSKLRKIVFPKNTLRLKEACMSHCSALREVSLPANVVFIDKRFLDNYSGIDRKVLITTNADSITSRTLRKYAADNTETVSIVENTDGNYELTIPLPNYSSGSNGFFSKLFSCF